MRPRSRGVNKELSSAVQRHVEDGTRDDRHFHWSSRVGVEVRGFEPLASSVREIEPAFAHGLAIL